MNRQLGFFFAASAILLTIPSCQKSFDAPFDSSPNGTDSTRDAMDSSTYAWELTHMSYPGLKDYEAGSFVINNTAYVLDVQGHLWSMDAAATSWVQKADLPFPTPPRPNGYFLISYPVVFSIGDKGYVTCGHWAYQNIGIVDQGSSTTLWEYDASKDQWTLRANFTGTARIMPVAVSGPDFALVGLGISQVDTLSTASSFLRYTPASNTWANAPDCGNDIALGTGFDADSLAFLIGDKPAAGSTTDHDNRLYRFSNATNSWKELAAVGKAKDWFTFSTAYAQKAFAVSTADNASTLTSVNLTTGAVTRHSVLPVPYSNGNTAFLFRLNNKLYLGDLIQKKIWSCKLG
jgi:hypothetical protein